jgi:hypothetical protein
LFVFWAYEVRVQRAPGVPTPFQGRDVENQTSREKTRGEIAKPWLFENCVLATHGALTRTNRLVMAGLDPAIHQSS